MSGIKVYNLSIGGTSFEAILYTTVDENTNQVLLSGNGVGGLFISQIKNSKPEVVIKTGGRDKIPDPLPVSNVVKDPNANKINTKVANIPSRVSIKSLKEIIAGLTVDTDPLYDSGDVDTIFFEGGWQNFTLPSIVTSFSLDWTGSSELYSRDTVANKRRIIFSTNDVRAVIGDFIGGTQVNGEWVSSIVSAEPAGYKNPDGKITTLSIASYDNQISFNGTSSSIDVLGYNNGGYTQLLFSTWTWTPKYFAGVGTYIDVVLCICGEQRYFDNTKVQLATTTGLIIDLYISRRLT